ncbi:MAG: tetratricopeptide repeat protein [Bacteroidota bacterium]
MRKLLLFIFIGLLSSLGICSNKIDSLRKVLVSKELADTARVNILNEIADLFEEKASDSCLHYAKQALKLSQNLGFFKGCGQAYNTIGSYYNGKGDYQHALANYIDGYKIYEKINNRRAMSNLMNSMGNTYMGIDNEKKAMEAYTRSYEIANQDSNKYMMGISSIGLGNIHMLRKNSMEALRFFSRARDVFQVVPTAVYPLAVSYTLIGNALVELNKFEDAFQAFNKAVDQLKTLNNTYGIAATYQVIGEAYKKQGNVNNALEFFLKSYDIFTERKAYDDLKNVSLNISEAYKQKKNFEKSLEYYTKYNGFKDSVLNVEKNRQLLEVETKYETEKKEEQNLLLKKQNDLSSETIRQQTIISYFIIVSLIISMLFGVFMYRVYRQKKKAHQLITQQKNQVEQKQIEIEHQKQVIEEKQKEIVDSINYAKRIQYALLAHEDLFKKNFNSHFVYFKPKDIVSGDFYWAAEHNNSFYLAICDSTGHGVPGAFMSLLNIGFLNEAIKEKDISQPNEIFNHVRRRLIESISSGDHKDGMDGVLIQLDKLTGKVTYSAANNAPVIIRNGEVILHPKDNMPIGKGEKEKDFSLFDLELRKGDELFLYTDGYADQFGGPKGKKFKYKALNELLIQMMNEPLNRQSEILGKQFEDWKGVLEQVDDVLVIGIKF